MASIKPLLAKILIQVGADEPKEIGTIEIPINVTIPEKAKPGVSFNINTPTHGLPEKVAEDVRNRLSYYHGRARARKDTTMNTITSETADHLTVLQEVCWQNSQDKGFHDGEPTDAAELAIYNGNRLMLIVSEAVEAHEEIRNGRPAGETYYPTKSIHEYGTHKPEGVPSEIADIVIRCFDFAGSNGFDLGAIIQEKLAYNSTRPHMHGKRF